MSLYSVVVPVYNSEHTLEELYRRLEKVFREVIKEDFELILVDDGSKDRSFEVMTELRNKDQRVRIIQMARNFGQHPALLCGFAHVRGDFVVTMDDDLQHQPEELPKMVKVMRERDDVDAIIARQRPESSDHQLPSDPSLPCRCDGKDEYISAADRQPSGADLEPYYQCAGTACRQSLRKERLLLQETSEGSDL